MSLSKSGLTTTRGILLTPACVSAEPLIAALSAISQMTLSHDSLISFAPPVLNHSNSIRSAPRSGCSLLVRLTVPTCSSQLGASAPEKRNFHRLAAKTQPEAPRGPFGQPIRPPSLLCLFQFHIFRQAGQISPERVLGNLNLQHIAPFGAFWFHCFPAFAPTPLNR